MRNKTEGFFRLNGWQRLYVVFIFFFYIPFLFILGDITPSRIDMALLENRLEESGLVKSNKKNEQAIVAYSSRDEFYKSPGRAKPNKDYGEDLVEENLAIVYEVSGKVSDFSEYYVYLPTGMEDKQVLEALQFFDDQYVKEAEKAIAIGWIKFFAAALGLALALYVFGAALGWVFRGFVSGRRSSV